MAESETRTTSGGAYYQTAVELREKARRAGASYPEALERIETVPDDEKPAAILHATHLAGAQVSFEVAAALLCVAQAIEDGIRG